MNILHIIAGDLSGGAAKGAYSLHVGLNNMGINSHVLSNSNIIVDDKNITYIGQTLWKRLIIKALRKTDGIPALFYRNRKNRIFSCGFVGYDFTKTLEYKRADIIHLHWVNDGFINIKHLLRIKKPIVWTMRDMWPMTGGCHYSLDCSRFEIGCGKCKQLDSNSHKDLSKIVISRKKKYFPRHIKFVGVSKWITNQASGSDLLKGFQLLTIYNNIDTSIFFPVNKLEARKSLGLNTNKKIILCGAANLNDFYKGFKELITAVDTLDRSKYYLCFFGKIDASIIENLGFDYKIFGFLHDTISLRMIYNCADVFVAPSRMDAFGKTIVESMSCGVPSVVFDTSGPAEIVEHMVDGYKAKPFSADDLAEGVQWICNNESYQLLSDNARNTARSRFDTKVIAEQYKNIYDCLLMT